MIHLDVGHKWGSYFIFTLTFPTGVMFDSSMQLARWPIGQVYLALGVGYISLHWILGWQLLIHHVQMQRGQSVRETSSHYSNLGMMQEDWNGMDASIWQMAVHLPDPPSSSMLMGWGYPWCGSLMNVGSSFWSSVQVPSLECRSSKPCACG